MNKALAILLLTLAVMPAFGQTDSVRILKTKPLTVTAERYVIRECLITLKSGKSIKGYSVYVGRPHSFGTYSKSNAAYFVGEMPLFGYLDEKGNKISRKLIGSALEKGQW